MVFLLYRWKTCTYKQKKYNYTYKYINYKKRDVSFNKLYKIKKVDYLIENVQNLGANVSLNITNYNGLIGKNKWNDDINEISEMTLSSSKDTLNGYTYNGEYFSLCNIGKNL